MAVTSERLLEIVIEASTQTTHLDAEGEVVFSTNPRLHDDSLARAIAAIASLSVHEQDIAANRHQFDVQTGSMFQGVSMAKAN